MLIFFFVWQICLRPVIQKTFLIQISLWMSQCDDQSVCLFVFVFVQRNRPNKIWIIQLFDLRNKSCIDSAKMDDSDGLKLDFSLLMIILFRFCSIYFFAIDISNLIWPFHHKHKLHIHFYIACIKKMWIEIDFIFIKIRFYLPLRKWISIR